MLMSLSEKKTKEPTKINHAHEILATTEYDEALATVINAYMEPYVKAGLSKYKSNGMISLYKEKKLDDRDWLIARYLEMLGKECKLSAEKRGAIAYVCNEAFFKVRHLFAVKYK